MSPIEVFFRDCVAALKRVAGHSRGDASLDDVKNEAWVMAEESALAGRPLDLTTSEGQDSLIRRLYGKFVKSLQTRIGNALRLDKDWDRADDAPGPTLADSIRAPETSNPLLALELRQALTPLELACRRSYSQATAYAICLHHWHDAKSLALYLCIGVDTVRCRIRYWGRWVEYQPSLFDGLEQIGLDFRPRRGVPVASDIAIHLDGQQQAWAF